MVEAVSGNAEGHERVSESVAHQSPRAQNQDLARRNAMGFPQVKDVLSNTNRLFVHVCPLDDMGLPMTGVLMWN